MNIFNKEEHGQVVSLYYQVMPYIDGRWDFEDYAEEYVDSTTGKKYTKYPEPCKDYIDSVCEVENILTRLQSSHRKTTDLELALLNLVINQSRCKKYYK